MKVSREGIICPACGNLHSLHSEEFDISESIGYWDTVSDWTCERCGVDFRVTTEVQRTWYSFLSDEDR